MHDFHLANKIVKLAQEHAEKNHLKKINKIFIELGDIIEHNELINPDNLRYNIKLLIPEVETIEIKKIKGDSWKLKYIECGK